MLADFREAIRTAKFAGSYAPAVAMGLNFIDKMVSQAAGQVNALKQAEKQTREALKAAGKDRGPEEPEKPEEYAPETPSQPQAEVPSVRP